MSQHRPHEERRPQQPPQGVWTVPDASARAWTPGIGHPAAADAAHARSLAPDLARGIMLLLIAIANVPWWLHGRELALASPHAPGAEGPDLAWQLVSLVAIDGRVYPLFAFLLGYGIWQLWIRQSAARTTRAEARGLLLRRHAAMVAIGAAHGLLLFFGDVVGSYGLVGLVVTWLLLERSDRALRVVCWVLAGLLLLGAAATLAGGLLLSALIPDDLALLAGQGIVPPAGQADYLRFAMESIALWAAATATSLPALAVPLATVLGVLAARQGLLDRPADHVRSLTRIAVGGIAVGWAGGGVAAAQHAGLLLPEELGWALSGATGAAGIAGGVGYAALVGLAAAALEGRGGHVAWAIAAVGKRSLTCYLLQSALFAPLLAAWGLGLGAVLSPLQAAGLAVGVWLVTLVVAVVLESLGRRGPAEAMLRELAYGGHPVLRPTPVA